MTHPRLQCGFTLIEVLVAMVVLATISGGLLATSWRLVGFARDEAEHMVADAYCHDVMWAVYSQNYTNILAGATESPSGTWTLPWTIDPENGELPRINRVSIFGKPEVIYPLWRTKDESKRPRCSVVVKETKNNTEEGEGTRKLITVEVTWHNGKEWIIHTNAVVRAPTDRRSE